MKNQYYLLLTDEYSFADDTWYVKRMGPYTAEEIEEKKGDLFDLSTAIYVVPYTPLHLFNNPNK